MHQCFIPLFLAVAQKVFISMCKLVVFRQGDTYVIDHNISHLNSLKSADGGIDLDV